MSTAKGEETRRRIVVAAWELSSARGVEQLLGGVTLREVAAAAGLSPSAVTYHFGQMRELALAMVDQFVEMLSPLPVDAVDAVLGLVPEQGLAEAVRGAAAANWAALTTPSEVGFERRLTRCYGVTGPDRDGPEVAAMLADLNRSWVHELAVIYERTCDAVGLRLVEPFTHRELALVLVSVAEGLLHHWMSEPDGIRPDLLSDVAVALVTVMTAPAGRPVALGELIVSLPRGADSSGCAEVDVDLVVAEGVAPMFAAGLESVTLTEVAGALQCGPEEVVERFGSMRRLAAISFRRHLAEIEAAACRRVDASARVRLSDAVYDLARKVVNDPHCAMALLFERLDSRLRPTPDRPDRDIRSLVPIAAAMSLLLSDLLEVPDSQRADLADLLVDTVLGYGATHPRTALSTIAELGLRVVAPGF